MTWRAAAICVAICASCAPACAADVVEPPWQPPPEDGRNFTVPGIDNVPDLYGDIIDPDLVVFLAGNQYMVVPELIAAFRAIHPQYRHIFIETLPPGVLADQIDQGAIVVGNLRIALKPDVYAAGRGRIDTLERERHWFAQTVDYARNRLAIMTQAGNPRGISGWRDLARPDLTLCMPNPKWEGIAANAIIPTLRGSGGDELVNQIYHRKADAGTTLLTQIHHRQTPLWIMSGRCEAGAVWYTEARFHEQRPAHGIGIVELPASENMLVTYTAAVMRDAPHRPAAAAFLQFLVSARGQEIYRKFGFLGMPGNHNDN